LVYVNKMKTRSWCFTNFNLEFDYEKYYNDTAAEYVAYGEETCPNTGKKHHQGWVYFNCQRSSVKGVAKELGCCHVEPCKGTITQNEDYCSKESTLITYGVCPKQGKRVDLDNLKNQILNGTKTVDDITIENPIAYHQYGRTLSKIEDIALRKKYRTWQTKGVWLYGPTGVGKSHTAFEGYSPDFTYVLPTDGGWWVGYTGQSTVIINEFRGNMPYAELLDLCDRWPKTVRRRGKEPVPFLAQKLIITSSMSPSECYSGLAERDSLEQLYRRFEIRFLAQKCSEGNTETSEPHMQNLIDNSADD